MSTKAQVQAAIDAIEDGQPNTAETARNAWNILANELYPTVHFSSWFLPNKTQSLLILFRYNVIFYKKGNTVYMSGKFESRVNVLANTDVFRFTDSEFYNLNNGGTILNFTIEQNGYVFTITDGVFKAITPIPLGVDIRLNFTFPTNP